MLAHTTLDNTLIYLTLEKALYGKEDSGKFHSSAATTTSEAAKLIETGFKYLCIAPKA